MNAKSLLAALTLALVITHVTKIIGCQQRQPDLTNLTFNAASASRPHGNALPIGYFTLNKTHLNMRYVPSPDKPATSISIPLTPDQHTLLTGVLHGQHFYRRSYVQAKNKNTLIWFALLNNQKKEL